MSVVIVGGTPDGTPSGIYIVTDEGIGQIIGELADVVNAAIPWGRCIHSPYLGAAKIIAVIVTQVTPETRRFRSDDVSLGGVVELLNVLDEAARGLDVTDLPLGAVARRILIGEALEIIDDRGRVIGYLTRNGGSTVSGCAFYGGDP